MSVENTDKTWLSKDDFTDRVPAMRQNDGTFRVLLHGDEDEDETVIANDAANKTGAGWDAVKEIYTGEE